MKKIFRGYSISKNCKGSHIGVILSFIIFVTFLVFIYSTLEPAIKTEKDKRFILEYLEATMIDKLSTNLTTLTVTIDKSINKKCLVLKDLIKSSPQLNQKIIVKDESKNDVISYISAEDGDDLIIQRENSEKTFFKIYGSEEFAVLPEEKIEECEVLTNEYEINLLKSGEYTSKIKILKMKEDYLIDYENLKKELRIPAGSEFGFNFTFNDGTFIETEEENVLKSVYVDEISVQYIDSSANILQGYLKIWVW